MLDKHISILNQTKQKIDNIKPFILELLDLLTYKENYELSILICGNDYMKKLNKTYRNKDKTTDVLSFPADFPPVLGDIAISLPQAKKQAEKGLVQELEMLLCHGLLHLLGYDHEKSEKDYWIMMNLQNQLLKSKKMELILL